MADVTVRGRRDLRPVGGLVLRSARRTRAGDRPRRSGAGASGGIVGALAPHVPENWNDKKAFQLDSLLMAAAFWAEVADGSGPLSGLCAPGRLQPVADDRALELAQARATRRQTLWQGHADWQVIRADGACAWAPRPRPAG